MEVIGKLLSHVLPLYAFIGAGYAASKWLGLQSKPVSKILLYVLIPVVIFDNLAKAELTQVMYAAIMVFVLGLLMNLPAWLTHRYIVKDVNKYLLSCSFSYFNIGWFGIPVVLALFGEKQMPLIISAYMGNVLYGDTIGYYLVSRSKDLPVKKALKNVIKIPAIYACIAAIVANLLGFKFPETLSPVMEGVSWILSALGMVIIGIGLTEVNLKQLDYKKYGKILGVRYLSAAVFMISLILLEMAVIGQLKSDEQKLLGLISAFPIAANLVVFASFLETESKNASLLVSLSSFISLLLVPVTCIILFG